MPSLRDVLVLLEQWYPPRTAEDWDAVGLVCGEPEAEVRRILLAVDPAPDVAREALAWEADLLVSHHPLLLRAVHSVAATTPKGRTLSSLVRGGCALLCAHTNADQAVGGVSHAMADALGLRDQQPLRPAAPHGAARDRLTVFVPVEEAGAMRAALAAAGAGSIGDYDEASFSTTGQARFRPGPGAQPHIGVVGRLETVDEERIEVILDRARRASVVAAMTAVHPYEEPAFDVLEIAASASGHDGPGQSVASSGTGRVGTVAATTLRDFAATVAAALPATAHGVRVGGDPDRVVGRVALCGGAGDFLLEEVRAADVDVYVTSDLRHHPASEFLEHDGPALIDVAHWAAEWTWLPVLERRLVEALGDTVEVRVSTLDTDPWTFRA